MSSLLDSWPTTALLAAFFAVVACPGAAAAAGGGGGGFTVARLRYGGGGDWYANPTSLPNLLRELGRRTTLDTSRKEAVVDLKSDSVFSHPFLYATGHGNIRFSPEEAERLRRYLKAGGFFWADDNYGMDKHIRREMARVFPDDPLVELPHDHPIYNVLYSFSGGLPKIHEHHGGPPRGYGLFLDGRLAFFYTYNTDIGDGLEDPDVHKDPPEVREKAMKMAINIVLYTLSH